ILRRIAKLETDDRKSPMAFHECALDVRPVDHSDLERAIEHATIVDDEPWAAIEELSDRDKPASAEEDDTNPPRHGVITPGDHERASRDEAQRGDHHHSPVCASRFGNDPFHGAFSWHRSGPPDGTGPRWARAARTRARRRRG